MIRVEIEAPGETVDGVEKVKNLGVNLYVGETGGDDLTAQQARDLAAFLSVALNSAADRIGDINAR
jgi:hypothetical protein